MQNFGFEDLAHWPSRRPSLKIFLFEWKWILVGLRGFIDRFWQNKFPPKSRYGMQTRLQAILEPATSFGRRAHTHTHTHTHKRQTQDNTKRIRDKHINYS